jgi:general secretion pathway protein D
VLIAEIRLDDETKMGVEWEYMNTMGENTPYNITSKGIDSLAEEIPNGLYYLVAKTDRFKATLRAFASKDKVDILSSPHVIAADNKEATIKITEEIPIVSGTVTTTTDTPYVTETTEYRDTGIILSVIPHINDKGLVTLELSQEVSEQSPRAATGSSNPIFLKRAAETSMVVQNGQSVIIGGLIKETFSKGKAGIPILSSIPVMGALFGYHKNTVNRSELMLLLTPHVITSSNEADDITQGFREKLEFLTDTDRLKKPKRGE